MEFNNIVITVALFVLIILLIIYGIFCIRINAKGYPETQDACPKLWTMDFSGNCYNPPKANCRGCLDPSNCTSTELLACNTLLTPGAWSNTTSTPGYINVAYGAFNSNDSGWAKFQNASSDICGKKIWANQNKIDWNGISTYNAC
jgi:hypothetical protein